MIKILKYSEVDKSTLFLRDESVTRVGATVAEIIENVRRNGDRALLDYALHFDKVSLSSLEVTQSELKDACERVSPELLGILERAAENIRAFHKNQVRSGFITNSTGGGDKRSARAAHRKGGLICSRRYGCIPVVGAYELHSGGYCRL